MLQRPKLVHEAPFMLQLVHHVLSQHSTARLALLPKAETKCEAEGSTVKQQILHYPIAYYVSMQYVPIISNVGGPGGQ